MFSLPVLSLLLGSLPTALGQTADKPAVPAIAPSTAPPAALRHVWLRVKADSVNLRSRADLNSQIVGRATQGQILESTGVDAGWHVLVPPPGVFSLAAAQFIERIDDAHGRVNVDTSLRIRVGSDVQPYDPMLCEVQTHLQKGAEVEILGALNADWLKIKPPPGVYVYVSSEFVEEIPEAEASRLRENAEASESGAEAAPAEADFAVNLPPPTSAEGETDLSTAWGQRLTALQGEIERLGKQEGEARDWTAIIEKLRPIAAQTDEPQVAALASDWLKKVEQQAKDEKLPPAAPVAAAPKPAAAAASQPAEWLVKVQPAPEKPRPSDKAFDAMGILRPSFAVPVGPYGLRYRLLSPATKKVVAYIEIPTELGVNVKDVVERYVGVKGTTFRLDDPKVTILRVTQLTILDSKTTYRETPQFPLQ